MAYEWVRPRVAGLAYKEPFEEHLAESKWQYCLCQTCQEKRFKMEQMPGAKIDWDKFRLKDEKY